LKTEFTESSPVDPRTPYAWSKYMTEKYCENRKHRNIIQGFRYFNVYGPGEEHKGGQASPYCQFERQAKENGVVKVFEGSENFKRDFIQVNEVIETHLRFLRVRESGVWNVGTGKTTSFLDVAKSFGVPIETIPMPENLKHSYQKYTCADLTKLDTTLEKYNA
jgi:ADP-L-glycero-D-manno-heptose 6-epimerase